MHVFIGGAYNGKRQFVKDWLQEQGVSNAQWFDGELPKALEDESVVVLHNLDYYIQQQDLGDEVATAEAVFKQIKAIEEYHHLIVILTDMGRGLVPIDKEARQLRDTCGRFYQLLLKESSHVTRIWYGLAETLK